MDRYRIKPGHKVRLDRFDPADTSAFDGDKARGQKRLLKLSEKLADLQELLWAGQRHRLLIVLQGMDTAGKDGTIRHVFGYVNPQGCRVANFKVPTLTELAHDYLWRVHQQVPGAGELVIFNRSHYEDVLVVRVHGLVPPAVWKKRYDHINAFEKLLADTGTTVLKFFLHISKEEQRQRLQERLDDKQKNWKFNVGDLAERKLWSKYVEAYQDALSKTSTPWAPWIVVPSDHKWYRNLVIAHHVTRALRKLNMAFPPAAPDLENVVVR
ncbi:MAG: Polyphosphate:AMP/ADP phosphotransferase [Phycisphaerae bacterium]|nr:Polyphosphate:AMP/ADP phosphotransferase [Phycisphaerae bacterium]